MRRESSHAALACDTHRTLWRFAIALVALTACVPDNPPPPRPHVNRLGAVTGCYAVTAGAWSPPTAEASFWALPSRIDLLAARSPRRENERDARAVGGGQRLWSWRRRNDEIIITGLDGFTGFDLSVTQHDTRLIGTARTLTDANPSAHSIASVQLTRVGCG